MVSGNSLDSLLSQLKSKTPDVRQRTAADLRRYAEEQSRALSGGGFVSFMDELIQKLFDVGNLSKSDRDAPYARLGAITAIHELIDVQYDENPQKITRFSNFLRNTLSNHHNDPQTVDLVAAALGRLASAGGSGTLTTEWVEVEAKRALTWLKGDGSRHKEDGRRYAAVCVLHQLADNAPTVFYRHVEVFLDNVWSAVWDLSAAVREAALLAVRSALRLVSERESSWRGQWYDLVRCKAVDGITTRKGPPEPIHGSLLVIGELVHYAREHMEPHFRTIVSAVFALLDHSSRAVRQAVVELVPRLARFEPSLFVDKYLSQAVMHLLAVLKHSSELRPAAYRSLGLLAQEVGSAMGPYVDSIVTAVNEGIAPRGRRATIEPEALRCAGRLAMALGGGVRGHVRGMVDAMFRVGLSAELTEALRDVSNAVPELLPEIQTRLLNLLSVILAGTLYRPSPTPGHQDRGSGTGGSDGHVKSDGSGIVDGTVSKIHGNALPQERVQDNSQLVVLALQTLGSFDMRGHNLVDFVRDCVLNYLDDDVAEIRKEAARTSCRLLVAERGDGMLPPVRGHAALVVGDVLEKLLMVGISDPDPSIRHTVLANLHPRFDYFLAFAENLRSLFIALNDEVYRIREAAMVVIGRLSTRNPAYVLPSLRKSLLQLLTELEFSEDARHKEESAKMLGKLIEAAPRLTKPYVASVLRVLVARIRDPSPAVAASVLGTVGELAVVGGPSMREHLDELVPVVLDAVQDQSAPSKRMEALHTLGRLVQATGDVVDPYRRYPGLMGVLLSVLKTEEAWSTRRAAMQVLGQLGAVDPFRLPRKPSGESGNTSPTTTSTTTTTSITTTTTTTTTTATAAMVDNRRGTGPDPMEGESSHGILHPSHEDYYPTVAMQALIHILQDPSLSAYHNSVVQAIMYVFSNLRTRCIRFLPDVVPLFLDLVRTAEPSIRASLFEKLSTLVSIVGAHIRGWVDDILATAAQFWHTELQTQAITLYEGLCHALHEEFKPYLPQLLPQLLRVLTTDRSTSRAPALRVLDALQAFGRQLDDFLYLVIPAVVRLFEQAGAPDTLRIAAIRAVGRMSRTLNVSEYASRIIHPLSRALTHPTLAYTAMDTLSELVYQLGPDYAIFVPMVSKVMSQHRIRDGRYEELVNLLLKNEALPSRDGRSGTADSLTEDPFDDVDDSMGSMTDVDGFDPDTPNAGSGTGSESVAGGEGIGSGIGEGETRIYVNQETLRTAWDASQRSTKEDWSEWLRTFSVSLLQESPSPALRACSAVARVYHPLARELFNAAFLSCWTELHARYQEEVVRAIELAFLAANLPVEVLQTLLNLAEFMEQDDKPLPIDIGALGALAEKCHTWAKALRYKEMEFQRQPSANIEPLIAINNRLQLHEAAMGILVYARKHHAVQLKEAWYEKLQRWEDAYAVYEEKQRRPDAGSAEDLMLGRMRCLAAMGAWHDLHRLTKVQTDSALRRRVAPLSAAAGWHLARWDAMAEAVGDMDPTDPTTLFYRGILAVHGGHYTTARDLIERTREHLDAKLSALVGESYSRAYDVVVRVQQLCELEETIAYREAGEDQSGHEQRERIRKMWTERLHGCQRNVDHWQEILAVRRLVVPMADDPQVWLRFAGLARRDGKLTLSHRVLTDLLGHQPGPDPTSAVLASRTDPRVAFAYLEHLWAAGEQQQAYQVLLQFVAERCPTNTSSPADRSLMDTELAARCFLRLGEWQRALNDPPKPEQLRGMLDHLHQSTRYAPTWYKPWHAWADRKSVV